MKKISSREFQKRFDQIAESMRNGQVLEITKRGKVIGRSIKSTGTKIKMPDFMAELKKHTYSVEFGNQLLKKFNRGIS
jgi:hypothetical protein